MPRRRPGSGGFRFGAKSPIRSPKPELLTVAAAFERFAGIDLLATIVDGEGDRDRLAAAARERIGIADDDTWSDIFSNCWSSIVEPKLGRAPDRAVRISGAGGALARARRPIARAERFEVYACGVELANGFGELTDAAEQRHRFTAAMDERRGAIASAIADEDFLAAVAEMPEASGVRSASTGW